jgi:plastocyanin
MLKAHLPLLCGLLLSFFSTPEARAGQLTGIIELPDDFKHTPEFETHGYWKGLRNEVLQTLPPLVDARTEMVVTLEGGDLEKKTLVPARILMEDARFVPPVLPVHQGLKVTFENKDSFLHLIEQEGKTKSMPVLRIARGSSASHAFTRTGAYRIRCSEVPHMRATVLVLVAPLYTVPDATGTFRFSGIRDGSYVVKVWYRGKWVHQEPVKVKAKTTFKVKLPVTLGKD